MATTLDSIKGDLTVTTTLDQRVRERAYCIWQAAGQPNGHDVAHWMLAEQELLDETRSLGDSVETRALELSR